MGDKPEKEIKGEQGKIDEETKIEETGKAEERVELFIPSSESEEAKGKEVSFSDDLTESSDDTTLKRNPVPEGPSEMMEDEHSVLQPPSPSQKGTDTSTKQSSSESIGDDVIVLDEATGTLPWEMYRYIKKEEKLEEDSDTEEYDGQMVGTGKCKKSFQALSFNHFYSVKC